MSFVWFACFLGAACLMSYLIWPERLLVPIGVWLILSRHTAMHPAVITLVSAGALVFVLAAYRVGTGYWAFSVVFSVIYGIVAVHFGRMAFAGGYDRLWQVVTLILVASVSFWLHVKAFWKIVCF